MEHLGKLIRQIRIRVLLLSLVLQMLIGLSCLIFLNTQSLAFSLIVIIFAILSLCSSLLVAFMAANYAKIPLKAFGNAITHASPSANPTTTIEIESLKIGREYLTNMVYLLHQIASLQDNKLLAEHKREATQASNILTHLPLPIIVFNNEQVVTFASDSALTYAGIDSSKLFGKPIYEAIDLEFQTEFTLESWIKDSQINKATDTAYWRRVRLKFNDGSGTIRQCDLSGYYSRDNPSGIEFIVTMFDRTHEYDKDDQSLNFIAVAVHELRTPLTHMRALIELFEDELQDKLSDEMMTFMKRLKSSSKQLNSFVNNVLNVARIQENQLTVKLSEENWADIIKRSGEDMQIQADGLGKQIRVTIDDATPSVAVDRTTMNEVLNNLIDNALKYSGDSKEILVNVAMTKDNLVETTVQDFGVGVPENIVPTLFEKFHRNHRNSSQVSGTGLGLYLSKAIVNAHGGEIWIKSKVGEGTTVGFTVQPFSTLSEELKKGQTQNGMVRTAHGWIKNHSLYRR